MSNRVDVALKPAARQMARIRAAQHLINEMLKERRFTVSVHMAFGYEALAVALREFCSERDKVILPHRNIAYQLAFGGSVLPIAREFICHPEGLAKGGLGSMNLAAAGSNIVYTTSILGNGVPVAVGFALNQRFGKGGGTTFAILGDGAMEEGSFYESLVFARAQGLKLVVIVENNNQSMSSTIAERRKDINLGRFGSSLGAPFFRADGSDLAECMGAMERAKSCAEQHCLPVIFEVDLCAYNQHAGPTPGWPSDPKSISLGEGVYIAPRDRDPVFRQSAIDADEVAAVFERALQSASGELNELK